MRILLVSQEYPPETAHGGIGTQTFMKAHGLSELGHQIFVLSHSIDGTRHESTDSEIRMIRVPGMNSGLIEMTETVRWLTYSTLITAEIERLSKRFEFDLIDFPEYGAEAFVSLLNRTDWKKIPIVMQLHGPLVMLAHAINWPDRESDFYKVGTFMEATCFRLADKVYSSSQCSVNWCQTHYFKRQDEIPIIHTGVSTDHFSPKLVEKHSDFTILFVGRIAKSKGVENLVDVVIDLSYEFPNLKLRLIGNGDKNYIQQLKLKASSIKKHGLLEFVGFVQKDELPEEYSKAHIFAAPSHFEGGPGFVYLEAMACGLPVIACNGSGIEEIIDSGKNGLLVTPNNNQELKSAIKILITDPKFAANIANAARNYVLKHADKKICIKKIEKLYSDLIGQ